MAQNQKKQYKIRRPKAFRSILIATWLGETYQPCKIADVGGGKGLLSYLLSEYYGWDCTVIDPEEQALPPKYTDLNGKRHRIPGGTHVDRIAQPFSPELIEEYDLIVGIHAHGSNIAIIDSCRKFDKDFFLMPCCVIDEPIVKRYGVNWRKSLIEHAENLGFNVKKVQLNFKGKNIGIYTDRGLVQRGDGDSEKVELVQIAEERSVV